ncbi:MAG: PadR family transcriptional regulator [Candidatus Altiarchaeia archaeon]
MVSKQKKDAGSKTDIPREWIKGFTELYALLYYKAHPGTSGYDLSKYIESEYGFRISYSKIYPLLDHLNKSGHISMKERSGTYPPKKVYRLTSRGGELIEQYRKVFMHFLEGF